MKIKLLSVFIIILMIANFFVSSATSLKSSSNDNLQIEDIAPKGTTGFIEWQTIFDSGYADYGHCIQPTTDGGYIVVGHGYGYKILLIKIDETGNIQWEKNFSHDHPDYGWYVLQTDDGGYLVLAETLNPGLHVWLIKTDSNGEKQWERFIRYKAQTACRCIQPTKDGGYILAGFTSPSAWLWAYDTWLLKIDSEGYEEWNRTFDRMYYNRAFFVEQTSDDGFILAGQISLTQGGYSDMWLIKTDENGYMQWNTIYGDTKPAELGKCVRQTSDGGYIVAGETQEPAGGFLVKTDEEGNILWTKPYGGNFVQQTSDGGYIVTGSKTYLLRPWWGCKDLQLIKTDSNGNKKWSKIYGAGYNDEGNFVMQTEDGGYIVVGSKEHQLNQYVANSDFWIIKTGESPKPRSFDKKPIVIMINYLLNNQLIQKLFNILKTTNR